MFQSKLEPAAFDPEDLGGLRARIMAETFGRYQQVRHALRPNFARVRRDIALGYLGLAAVLFALTQVSAGMATALASATLGSVVIGFLVAYLQLFLHEGAHYNLADDRGANDRLANLFICWFIGTDIASYRISHWEHHRSLGTEHDTEVSYRNPLRWPFLLAMLTGVHAMRVFLERQRSAAAVKAGVARAWLPLARGAAIHLALLALLISVGSWTAVLAWIIGMAVFFPFFATLRQLLEHRPSGKGDADAAVNRLFGDGPFAAVFGGAGFNRHYLHHLEPQLSYTRLREFEQFLMTTSARHELDARRTTYGRAFAALIRSDHRD